MVDGCDACSEEISIISNIQKRAGIDANVWGIVRESGKSLSEFKFNRQETSIPIIVDLGDNLRQELKITAFPYNLLLKDGVIIKKWIGIKDEETLLSQIKD